jgi:glycosyltransferase involved in cell wall biosynthesis
MELGDSTTVIVSTYNKKDHLALCLQSIAGQTCLPSEIIIADDGSDENTGKVIHEFSIRHPRLSVKHSWQENKGFRKTLALNRAVSMATSQYLIFIDDDCICRPNFVAVHQKRKAFGRYLVGSSMHLGAELTSKVLEGNVKIHEVIDVPSAWLPHGFSSVGMRRKLKLWFRYQLSSSGLGNLADQIYPFPATFRGGNSSVWRSDAVAINGFNNSFQYGQEDREFGLRLRNFGIRPRQVRYEAANFHLYHKRGYDSPDVVRSQREICRETARTGSYWAADGLIESETNC